MFVGRANFSGRHNRSKTKVWMYLAAVQAKSRKGASNNEIHEATGVPIRTLRRHMDKWWSWGRIHKIKLAKPLLDGSTCMYSIGASGKRYINCTVPEDVYEECKAEIQSWQEERGKTKEQKHREFIEAYKAKIRDSGQKPVLVPNPNRNRILTG